MPVLTREERKKDIEKVMQALELRPEDSAYKLIMKLTKQGNRSILAILNMDKDGLGHLDASDTDNTKLTLDPWEVSELINISRYATFQQAEKGEDFRLKNIDIGAFKDFKLSPECTQMQYAQGDITRTPIAILASAHSPAASQYKTLTPAESFKRGIKRDSTIFNPFKEGKQ